MSFYRFNDTITLYTPIEYDYYERRIVTAVKTELIETDGKTGKKATVYIPIHSRRSLKYRAPSEKAMYEKSSFIVTAGQKIYLGRCPDEYPPESSLTVKTAVAHLSGSRHVQHVKIVAQNDPSEEENYE